MSLALETLSEPQKAAFRGYIGAADPGTLAALVEDAEIAAAAAVDAAASADYLPVTNALAGAGGSRNLFPDPFFTETTVSGGFGDSPATSPLAIVVSSGSWSLIEAPANSPYPAGRVLRRNVGAGETGHGVVLFGEKLGLFAGDVFQIGFEMAFIAAGSDAALTFVTGQFESRGGGDVGAPVNLVTASAPAPLDTTLRTFVTGDLTWPTGASRLLLDFPQRFVANAYGLYSLQVVKGDAADKPIQRFTPPDLVGRIDALEAASPGTAANAVTLRRTGYSARAAAPLVGAIANYLSITFAAHGGYGQSFLPAACPAGGFNAVTGPWQWTPDALTGAARIEVVVRTGPSGSNSLITGTTIATGWIATDPTAGSAGAEPVALFDPVTGLPKTVTPADLDDVWSVGVVAITAAGTLASEFHIPRADSIANADPAFPYWHIPSGNFGSDCAWTNLGFYAIPPRLELLSDPVTATNTPSPSFVDRVGLLLDEPPALIACPEKMWAIAGHPTWLHFQPLQHRDSRRTGFYAALSGAALGGFPGDPSGQYEEGFLWQPGAAGTLTLALSAGFGDRPAIDSASIEIVACAAGAAAGTKKVLMIGDSMTANAGVQAALNDLAAADGVTAITNQGSQGAAPLKNEGRSGQPLGWFTSAASPFYNAGSFDFAYYVTNSLGGVPPTHVLIAGGFWDVQGAASDAAAQIGAANVAILMQVMIDSIHAYDATIKVGLWAQPSQPRNGQDGQARPIDNGQQRKTRNLRLLAANTIATFSGQGGDGVYVVAVNAAMNPETGYPKASFAPLNDGVSAGAVTFASHAAMIADLAHNHGVIAKTANGGGFEWFIKMFASGGGFWRAVDEHDGFVRRFTDTIHQGSGGTRQMGEQVFAWIKNNP